MAGQTSPVRLAANNGEALDMRQVGSNTTLSLERRGEMSWHMLRTYYTRQTIGESQLKELRQQFSDWLSNDVEAHHENLFSSINSFCVDLLNDCTGMIDESEDPAGRYETCERKRYLLANMIYAQLCLHTGLPPERRAEMRRMQVELGVSSDELSLFVMEIFESVRDSVVPVVLDEDEE